MPKNDSFVRMTYEMRMKAGGKRAEVMVYGEISPVKFWEDDPVTTAKDFDKLIKQAKADGAEALDIRINSPGGTVSQAVAMRMMVMNAGFSSVDVSIEGMCASAATLLCCIPGACVSISTGSEFMIHNPIGYMGWAGAADMEKAAERLHKQEETFAGIYAERTGKSAEEIRRLMDAETWFTAEEAVEFGFCDSVSDAMDAAACAMPEEIREMYRNVPEHVAIAAERISNAEPEAVAGDAAEIHSDEEDNSMEMNEITMEQLRGGNADVYAQILQAGAELERARMQEIDEMTPPGYEALGQQAKASGVSGAEFAKMLAKAMREKGTAYLNNRAAETAAAAQIDGGDSGDHDDKTEEDELKAYAAELKQLAKTMHFEANLNGMY